MARTYSIAEEEKKIFAGLYLLEYMINTPYSPPIFLDGNDQDLETILADLLARGMVSIKDEEKYIPTPLGRKHLENFMARYSEYLTMFDIFCGVDLEAGEFAFASWGDFATDEEFRQFLHQDRFADLRVAVADYKGMNSVEIVFMSFINEQRFGRDQSGWQFDLLLGSVWDEILDICRNSIQWEELGYADEEGEVSAEAVIEDIIIQGTELMLELLGERPVQDTPGESPPDGAEPRAGGVAPPQFDSQFYEHYLDPKFKSGNWRNH